MDISPGRCPGLDSFGPSGRAVVCRRTHEDWAGRRNL